MARPWWGGVSQAWGKVGVAPAPVAHHLVCPRFSPDLGRAGPLAVENRGPPGATWNLESEARGSPARGSHKSGSLKSGETGPHPRATPLSH